MTVPYDRIRGRIDYTAIACLMCTKVTVLPVIDHCHEHGLTRGVLCVSCNNRMARVDADLTLATADELFYRDNCPECRREGHAGLARRIAEQARAAGVARTPRVARAVSVSRRIVPPATRTPSVGGTRTSPGAPGPATAAERVALAALHRQLAAEGRIISQRTVRAGLPAFGLEVTKIRALALAKEFNAAPWCSEVAS